MEKGGQVGEGERSVRAEGQVLLNQFFNIYYRTPHRQGSAFISNFLFKKIN